MALSNDPAILYPSAQVAVVVLPTVAFPSGERVPFKRVSLWHTEIKYMYLPIFTVAEEFLLLITVAIIVNQQFYSHQVKVSHYRDLRKIQSISFFREFGLRKHLVIVKSLRCKCLRHEK